MSHAEIFLDEGVVNFASISRMVVHEEHCNGRPYLASLARKQFLLGTGNSSILKLLGAHYTEMAA